MKCRSAEECITRILRDIEKRKNTSIIDFDNRNVLRRYNAAMNRIIENANYLWENYPEQRDRLIDLMYSTDCYVASHCAHIVYGMKDSSVAQKKLALSVVKKLATHPDVPELSKYGMMLNIKYWEAELKIQE